MTTKYALLATMIAATTAISCTGIDSDEPRGRERASLESLAHACDTWSQHALACGDEPMTGEELQECSSSSIWTLLWSQVITDLDGCLQALPCGESDDQCLDQAMSNLGIDPATDPVYLDCMERAEQCGLWDDLCGMTLVFHDAAREQASACLSGACADIESCMTAPLP